MSARHIYVDETKERDYVLVASVHLGAEANTLRKAMRGFVLRGQTRIHLAKESTRAAHQETYAFPGRRNCGERRQCGCQGHAATRSTTVEP